MTSQVSRDDGLRERVYREILLTEAVTANVASRLADAVLALPELAALRAKADAADRVRELHGSFERWADATWLNVRETACRECLSRYPCATVRALDGPPPGRRRSGSASA